MLGKSWSGGGLVVGEKGEKKREEDRRKEDKRNKVKRLLSGQNSY